MPILLQIGPVVLAVERSPLNMKYYARPNVITYLKTTIIFYRTHGGSNLRYIAQQGGGDRAFSPNHRQTPPSR